MRSSLSIVALLALISPLSAAEFELKDGDKVVWLGSTLIEREQRYGYWETALTARWPERKITFRNLGWSGDNVFGEARLAFDLNNPALGLKRMVDLTLAEKPTVIFICFGTNESFEGEAGLEKFEKGYEKLLDELKPAKARIVLMEPPEFQTIASIKFNAQRHTENLLDYGKVIKRVAQKRMLTFVSLLSLLHITAPEEERPELMDNGIHLTEKGYEKTVSGLGHMLNVVLTYRDSMDPLRQAIIAKNQLYFYRWRPQNETYLFGFRKKEQGQNAKEIAEFDPLIAKAEEEIERLKRKK